MAAEMADALMGEEMNGELGAALGDDEAAEGAGMFDEGEGLELAGGAPEDLDEAFAADA